MQFEYNPAMARAAHRPVAEDENNTETTGLLPQSPHQSSEETASSFKFETNPVEKLGVGALSILVFYNVSGGPFGVESSLRAAGNFWTLVGFLVIPCCWSVQEAVITAELGAAFPEASGGAAWVEEAFGPLAGWISGYLNWVAGATDNAIYPVLLLEYVSQFTTADGAAEDSAIHPGLLRILVLFGLSTGMAYINWLGLVLVGKISIFICLIAMSPFVLMTFVGISQCDPSRWFEIPTSVDSDDTVNFWDAGFVVQGVMWRPLLNNLYWNLCSFDAAGSFAADVKDIKRDYVPGMMWGLVFVILGYLIPLLVATGASHSVRSDWVDGYLAGVAYEIGGFWLGGWTILAAAVSNIALFQAEMSADAYQVMGLAERGFLPAIFTERSANGTPTYGIILGTAVIVVITSLCNFDELIELLNFNYALSMVLEFAAFIKLRISQPNRHRPWKLPLGTFGCVVFILPAFLFIAVIIAVASWKSYAFSTPVTLFGFLLYRLSSKAKNKLPLNRDKSGHF